MARTPTPIALKTRPAETAAPRLKSRLDLFRFLPFRLNRLAAEVSSALAVEYQERHGLDIPAWRVIATLGFRNDACSAQVISQCTRTHKASISRAVTTLLNDGLIERVGLDYFIIDCAETPSGDLLVFEIDNTAVVHDMDSAELYPYKPPQMHKIFDAFTAMLERRAAARRQNVA